MKFETQVTVLSEGICIGVLEMHDGTHDGGEVVWNFHSEGVVLSQQELEQIAAKLRELNEAARPGVKGE